MQSDEARHISNGYATLLTVLQEDDNAPLIERDLAQAWWINHAYLDGFVANGRAKGLQLVLTRGGRIAHVSARGHRDAEAGLRRIADRRTEPAAQHADRRDGDVSRADAEAAVGARHRAREASGPGPLV